MNIINNVNDFYNMNDSDKDLYTNSITNAIINSDNEVLKKMLKVVDKNVKNYKSDFTVHDVKYLSENPDCDMVWIVRENGTHLLKLNLDTKNEMVEQAKHYTYILNIHRNNPSIKVYFVNMKENKIKKTNSIEFTYENE